jgi:hypothetical protein
MVILQLAVLRMYNTDFLKDFWVNFSGHNCVSLWNLVAECEIYVSDFHRERCWEHWITLADRDVRSARNEALIRLRRVALASTIHQFNAVKDELTTSQVWQNSSSLQNWFETTWLNEPKACVFVLNCLHILAMASCCFFLMLIFCAYWQEICCCLHERKS